MEDKAHKAHHRPSTGSKLAKKDVAHGVDRTGGQSFNPKVRQSCPYLAEHQAFTSTSFRSADRAARRTAEKDQRRLHVPTGQSQSGRAQGDD